MDFSAEAERALQVMDYAVLVISGTDGVQSHTETLWRLLERYQVPVFIFLNKMDLAGADRAARMDEAAPALRLRLRGHGLAGQRGGAGALQRGAAGGRRRRAAPTEEQLAAAISRRELFPCYFGAALKLEGVDALLDALARLTSPLPPCADFGARIFKVTRAEDGARLTWLKVTGGELKVKAELASRPDAARAWRAKADQLRLYSGAKYSLLNAAPPGTVCAVTGLAGQLPRRGPGL